MEEQSALIDETFASTNAPLPEDIRRELNSIARLHSISAQELFYKWESYNIKNRSGDNLKLDLRNVRNFKKDIADSLERDARDKKPVAATPRVARGGGAFDLLEGIIGESTPQASSIKRKAQFATPAAKASKVRADTSPSNAKNAVAASTPFDERKNKGEILETLNAHIGIPTTSRTEAGQARVKLTANSELNKFSYKPMAMKLSAASEILDDRIDIFLDLIQQHYQLEDNAFGNPASQSPNEIIAVGRIASDSTEGKLNAASMVMETSRRSGAGLRVRLDLSEIKHFDLFPGKIIAVKGSNPSGETFKATEILETPLLPPAASSAADFSAAFERMSSASADDSGVGPETVVPLNIMTAAGPYTTDDNLAYEALHALCERAIETKADALILVGPFLDAEHPMVALGDFPPLPSSIDVSSDSANLTDVFRGLISLPLERVVRALPSITIILVPSVRDTISKHTAWPQDRVPKKGLGLPKQCFVVTNPIIIALNEIVFAISSQDVLYELKRESCSKQTADSKPVLDRLARNMIDQRHFFPLFPPSQRDALVRPTATVGLDENERDYKAIGASLDITYLALGEWQNRLPDILITPSSLTPFAKVVDSVVVVNPGSLSKRRGPGNFGHMYIDARLPSELSGQDGTFFNHNVFERIRVDIVKI